MIKTLVGAATMLGLVMTSVLPAMSAGTVGNYHEYSTPYPKQGWVGVGRKSGYCDFIRYPIKDCGYHKVCKGGKCWSKRSCKFVGWDIRQSCY